MGWKQEGNAAFQAKDYAAAVRLYSLALKQQQAEAADAGDSAEQAVLYTNRSTAYGACGMASEALADADRALALVPRHVKAHYRRGASLIDLHRYEEAVKALQEAEALESSNRDIARQLRLAREYLALDEHTRECTPFTPFPVEPGHLPTKGRALFATRKLQPGDVVLRCAPTAAVLDDDCLLSYCSLCFTPLATVGEEARPCGDCRSYVLCHLCADNQEERAMHAGECRVIQMLLQQQGTNGNSDHRDLRLAMRVLLYRARGHERRIEKANAQAEEEADDAECASEGDDTQGTTSELEQWWIRDSAEAAFDGKSLVEHHDRLTEEVRESFRQQARNLRWFAAHGPALAVSDSDVSVARLFAIAQANALTLSDPSSLRPIGQGLYASAALLNHSCLPNANWSVDGKGMLCVRAVRTIEAGEEVTVSYIDPTRPYHTRQQELQDTFFFACRCPQCRPPPLDLRDYFVADELMVMVKCPNTMDDRSASEDEDENEEEGEPEKQESSKAGSEADMHVCGQGMVTIAVRRAPADGGESTRASSGGDEDECEGRLECVECGYELPGDYAQSVEAIVNERALARLTRHSSKEERSTGAGDKTDDDGSDYEGLVAAIEEGMGLLHPCHRSLRVLVEHLLFASLERDDVLMHVYAAQTLVHTYHAYLRHPRLHLHVALLHLLSGHALLHPTTTQSSSSSASLSSHPPPSWSPEESPLRLGVPSIFGARLSAERANWPALGTEYLRMAHRHLGLLLGSRHWLPRMARRCIKGRCLSYVDAAAGRTLPARQRNGQPAVCALLAAYLALR